MRAPRVITSPPTLPLFLSTPLLSLSLSEVRNNLSEQLRVFDSHLEQKTQILQDLSDYLRRRGEIEGEYARALDKLADKFTSKTKK